MFEAGMRIGLAEFDGMDIAISKADFRIVLVGFMSVLVSPCAILRAADPNFAAAASAYKQSFLENDFSYLDADDYSGGYLGESLKRLRPYRNVTVDVGGRYRARYHNENNLRRRRLTGASDDFVLHQTFLFADIHLGDELRIFAQGIDANSDGNDLQPRATEVNRLDMQMLAIDALLWGDGGDQELWIRGGRQEMYYGSQRLVASRPWRNTPLTHDGFRMWWKDGDHRWDTFWVRPINPSQHLPEDHNFDHPDQSRQFYGSFFETKNKQRTLNLFYFGLTEQDNIVPAFDGTLGGFDLHTVGSRILADQSDTMIELEGGYQFGKFTGSQQSAGYFTAGIGRRMNRLPLSPTVWLYYDWASGDNDLGDDIHATFYHLEPRGHYYLGWADLTGRRNIQDLNLQTAFDVTDRVVGQIQLHNFWLANRNDALYSPGGSPIFHDPSGSAGKELGHELDLQLRWTITPRAHLLVGYSYLWAGDYFDSPVIQGGPAGTAANGADGNDGELTYVQFSLRF
tara:strand:- start:550913 stop:552448 length:1536 start_codon:yes stop_codon:yes gene_type:complete